MFKGIRYTMLSASLEDKTILGQSLAIPAHPRFASTPEQSVVHRLRKDLTTEAGTCMEA